MSNDCACVTVSTLVSRARVSLNDHVEKCHWSDKELSSYLAEGMSMLNAMRPDAFVVVEEIELQPGTRQVIPDGYDTLVAVVTNSSDSGDGAPVQATDDTYARVTPSPCHTGDCGAGGTGEIETFSIFQQSQRHFTVSPPVPADKTVKVVARLVKDPPCSLDLNDCVDVAKKFHAPLVFWVLSRAFSKDIESAYALGMADRYYRWFFETLEAQRVNEARFRSGYHLGMIGDEDGQLRSR